MALHAIDIRATKLLAAHGYPSLLEEPAPAVEAFGRFAEENETWVALHDGAPVGCAIAGRIAEFLHLKELAVDPSYGRNGLGSALLAATYAHAVEHNYTGVSLSTFRNVPFNAPFYSARGFAELAQASAPAELRAQFFQEVPHGVDPTSRVLMVRYASRRRRISGQREAIVRRNKSLLRSLS